MIPFKRMLISPPFNIKLFQWEEHIDCQQYNHLNFIMGDQNSTPFHHGET